MKTDRSLFVGSAIVLGVILLGQPFAVRSLREALAAGNAAASAVSAAKDALASLDAAQRERASFSFESPERFNWHFIPRSRKGVPLRELDASQKEKVRALLATSLSETGVKKAEQVRGLEAVLAEQEGPNRRFARDPELYFLSVFGTPGESEKWGWRFEGHHMSLNFTLEEGKLVAATPLMFGANPARVKEGPHAGLRVLAGVEDTARELVSALSAEQLSEALGEGDPKEVEATERKTYDEALPDGLAGDKLEEEQKARLKKLIDEYVRFLPAETARRLHERIAEDGLGKVQLAWRGGRKPGEGHSYIVHAPSFVISYANFQNDAAHIHCAVRERGRDFGG